MASKHTVEFGTNRLWVDGVGIKINGENNLIDVNKLVLLIWKGHRRELYRKTVRNKAENVCSKYHNNDFFMMIPISELKDKLTEWCHKDEAAKTQLLEFNFEFLFDCIKTYKQKIKRKLVDELEQNIEGYKRAIEEYKSMIQRAEQQIMQTQAELE